MLKKKITYQDFNGDETTEVLHFHFNKMELAKLEVKYSGDIEKHIRGLQARQDGLAMFDFIEELVLSAYGEKSEDGKRFIKTKEVRERFEYSQAYAELFEQLLTMPDEARKFGEGLIQNPGAEKAANAKAITNLMK